MGVIAIEEIEVHAYHGVYQKEREIGTTFRVDLYMKTDIRKPAKTDQLEDTLDYFSIYQLVCEILEHPVNLLEHLCDKIGNKVMTDFEAVENVRVRVSKLKPLGMEKCGRTYIEMFFDRKDILGGK
ncbi:MAG: dihydroneopterin aldolase [Bacteroidota bacterium]